ERDEDPNKALDLLERQDLGARQELVILAEDLFGHAVNTPEVAAIGDADPQVTKRPAERVQRICPHVKSMRLWYPRPYAERRARTASLIAASFGNPPSRVIECTRSPSTETSKVPPSHGMSSM